MFIINICKKQKVECVTFDSAASVRAWFAPTEVDEVATNLVRHWDTWWSSLACGGGKTVIKKAEQEALQTDQAPIH